MMKAKKPGFIFEHIARAVRSEGPVSNPIFSSEDLSSSLVSVHSMPISGTPEKKKKNKLQSTLRRRRPKTKRMIN